MSALVRLWKSASMCVCVCVCVCVWLSSGSLYPQAWKSGLQWHTSLHVTGANREGEGPQLSISHFHLWPLVLNTEPGNNRREGVSVSACVIESSTFNLSLFAWKKIEMAIKDWFSPELHKISPEKRESCILKGCMRTPSCVYVCSCVCACVTESVRGRGSAGDLAKVVTERSVCVKVCVVCACANYQSAGQPGQQTEGRHSNRHTLCQAVSMMVEQKNRMCTCLWNRRLVPQVVHECFPLKSWHPVWHLKDIIPVCEQPHCRILSQSSCMLNIQGPVCQIWW